LGIAASFWNLGRIPDIIGIFDGSSDGGITLFPIAWGRPGATFRRFSRRAASVGLVNENKLPSIRECHNSNLGAYISPMGHIDTCLGILRRLIAKGDTNGIPLAERAIDEYWDAAPVQARVSGLRFLHQDVLDQRNAAMGNQRNFADIVSAYIEKKLTAE
jgi:hypothetical protein